VRHIKSQRQGAAAVLALTFAPLIAAASVRESTYARAERFLSWNETRYVRNGDLEYQWLRNPERLRYEVEIDPSERRVVLVDLATARKTVIEPSEPGPQNTTAATQDPAKSPDGHWVAFLRDHNLWLRSTSSGTEQALTTDGTADNAYASSPGYSTHAISDLRLHRAPSPQVVWSPDSRYLLTHRIDERDVKEFFLVASSLTPQSPRPALYRYRYALPEDERLPMWQPIVFDVAGGQRRLDLPVPPLVCSVMTAIEQKAAWWAPDSRAFFYLKRDRYSKSIALERVDIRKGEAHELLGESTDTAIQVNAGNPFEEPPLIRTLANGDVLWYSQRDGWGHLYYYEASGRLRNAITRGPWAVERIVRIDERARRLYFLAMGREPGRDPYERYLYRIDFDASHLRLLTPDEGDHDVTEDAFAPSGRAFVDRYSRPDRPPTFALRSLDGKLISSLEQADISKLRAGGWTPIEPFSVMAADGTTRVHGNLFRPSDFDPRRSYPVIDSIYPGPQATRTRKGFLEATFDIFEAQSLAELGFIVVTIDGRGTPGRSKAFLDHSYGHLERASDLEDHLAAIRELAARYSYLDLGRVGIDGASAGGYAATHALLAYPKFFKVAVAAAGNHDQRAYVAPWADTYMGPDLASGSDLASNMPLARNLSGRLLLMHGEMDDNVSPALTLRLVHALIAANKDFDLLLIPDANHLAWQSPYFIRRKWDYFVTHLLGETPPASYMIAAPL